MEASRPHIERYVAQLSREVDLLTEKNRNLEARLGHAESRISIERLQELNLDARNQALVEELIAVEKLVQSLQQEKDRVLQAADRENTQLRKECQQYKADLNFTETQLDQANQERNELSASLKESSKKSADTYIELRDTTAFLERVQHEKRQLADRIERLSTNERALVLENERLKRHYKTAGGSGMSPNQLERYMSGVEEDKEYYRREADLLQQMLNSLKQQQVGLATFVEKQDRTKSPNGKSRGRASVKTLSASPAKAGGKRTPLSKLSVDKLDREIPTKDKPREVSQLSMRERSQSPSMRGRSPIRSINKTPENAQPDYRLLEVTRERDELRSLLSNLEKRVIDIQGQVRILTQERDHLHTLHEESRQELRRVREDLMQAEDSYGRSNCTTQSLLCRAEEERDNAMNELRRLSVDFDKLREQHRCTVDLANHDKKLLESKIEDLSRSVRATSAEREKLHERVSALRQDLSSSEANLKITTSEVQQLKQQLEESESSHSKSRLRVENLQMQLEGVESQVERMRQELDRSKDVENVLCDRLERMSQELKFERDNYAKLRVESSRRDGEHQELRADYDQAVANCESKERELHKVHNEMHSLNEQLREANFRINQMRESLVTRERSEHNLNKQLDATTLELELMKKKFNESFKEGNQLKSDVAHLSRSNRTLQQDLEVAANEREDLQHKVQDYLAEIKRAEDLLAYKEQEQGQLLEKYRNLSDSADEKDVQLRKLQSDLATLRSHLEASEDDLHQTQDTLKAAEKENWEFRASMSSAEQQIVSLQGAIDSVSRQLRASQRERDELLNDLRDLRDVCNRLESAKNDLEGELTNKGLDLDQMAAQIDDLHQELDGLRDQLDQEHDNKISLETVLQSSRDKERQTQLDYQEKASEALLLKERVSVMSDDLENARHDVDRLKTRNQELERDIERLHRSLSGERFEKERLMSELRIQSLSPPPKISGTTRSLRSPNPRSSSPGR